MKKICYGTLVMLFLSYSAIQAQDEIVEMAETPIDNSSMVVSKEDIPYTVTQPFIRPRILPDDIMYRKAVWRRLDGKEKINQSFFTFQNEITKLIIESVKTGTLQPYKNDSLTTRMSKEEFLENLKVPGMDDPTKTESSVVDPFGADDSAWGASSTSTGANKPNEKVSNEFLPREVTVLEIKENVIFDKRRSRMDIRMHSITLVVPAERLATGIDRVLATFSYADLEKLFRENPDKAIWFNAYNSKEHKNYADAFELRLFKARIYKIEEPSGDDLATIYPDLRAALIASELKELELMEYEHNLWEY